VSLNRFISGDWGTSRLRLRLVQREPFRILETIESARGVAAVYDGWELSGESRENYFEAVVCKSLEQFQESVIGLPVLVSGMASSTIGWCELPYAPLPHRLKDPLASKVVGAALDVRLVSGLRWETRDVMRGEESQVVGVWGNPTLNLPSRFRLILPGTHSKHVLIEDDTITAFQTFLTGDLFQAIGRYSILKHSVDMRTEVVANDAFREGVRRSQTDPMDHVLFSLRCADLFNEREAAENVAFLSGLLIGGEMSALAEGAETVVVAETALGKLYAAALKVVVESARLVLISETVLDESVARSHARLFGSSSQSCSQGVD
jgi:2-dehydro-3-deoxygalactonokinase